MSLHRFNDADALTLRALVNRYGIDSVAHELWTIIRHYSGTRFRFAIAASKRLSYAAGLAMGTAPKPY